MTWEEAVSVHGLAGTAFAAQKVQHGVGETVAVVGNGGHPKTATRHVIDQRGGRPGAVGGVGVQVKIDGVRRS